MSFFFFTAVKMTGTKNIFKKTNNIFKTALFWCWNSSLLHYKRKLYIQGRTHKKINNKCAETLE